MSYAVKAVSTERGLDAAAFTLIAYGGAGPLHASAIAREIGMQRVIVPRAPGHFCAFGMLFSDLRYDFVRTWFARLTDVSFDAIERIYESLIADGRKALAASGVQAQEAAVSRAADMRYVGQEHPVTVELPAGVFRRRNRDALKRSFDDEHQRRYGTGAPGGPARIVSLRATVTGAMKKPRLDRIKPRGRAPPASTRPGKRRADFAELGRSRATPNYPRAGPTARYRIHGPGRLHAHP